MVFLREERGDKVYERINDKLNIGKAELDNILYYFYKDKFYSVNIMFSSLHNFQSINAALSNWYGPPSDIKRDQEKKWLIWYGKYLGIISIYHASSKKGFVFYMYHPIRRYKLGGEDL